MTESEKFRAEAFATGVFAKGLILSGIPVTPSFAYLTCLNIYTWVSRIPLPPTDNGANEFFAHQVIKYSIIPFLAGTAGIYFGVKLNRRAARIRSLSKSAGNPLSLCEIL